MIKLFGGLSLALRLGIIATVVAALVGAFVLYRNSVWNAGHAAAMAKVEKQNKEAAGRAHQAIARRRACSTGGGVWNHVTGECDRGL